MAVFRERKKENRVVQPQKTSRAMKFNIEEGKLLY